MNITQNNLCIIPARGGSKRIPRKNIKNFLGKPIIAYSIEAALQSGLFEEVMVSTNDEEIAEIARRFGANVPFLRSNETSDDFATTLDVIREVVEKFSLKGRAFDYICCLYPTAPFISKEKIMEAFNKLVDYQFDSVFPVMRYSFPIQRSLYMNSSSQIKYKFEEFKNARSQDLIPTYHDAGQFYWMKQIVLDSDSIVNNNTGAIEISELEGQDIDNEIDWKLAELKYELIQGIK